MVGSQTFTDLDSWLNSYAFPTNTTSQTELGNFDVYLDTLFYNLMGDISDNTADTDFGTLFAEKYCPTLCGDYECPDIYYQTWCEENDHPKTHCTCRYRKKRGLTGQGRQQQRGKHCRETIS